VAKRTKGGKRKIAQKKPAKQVNEFVIVGSYKERQLKWIGDNGVYNYPVREGDGFNDDALRAVKELWLFANVKGERKAFAVKGYVGKMTKAAFIAKYPSYKRPTHDAYYVFEVTPLDYEPTVNTEIVIARTADFGRATGVKKAVKQFKADGEYGPLAAYLPKPLSKVPPKQLRVSEEAVQMEFFSVLGESSGVGFPFPAPKVGKFTFIDLFAGIGGIRLGFQMNGGKCVFSSEWDKDAAKTYYYNFGERPFGDIQKIEPKSIPDFDVLLAGFPCQPFSIIGDKEGFNHETQGTLFFNIEKILLAKKPKAFMLENVRNLTAHDNGRTFKVILAHLRNAGYDVHYKVLNALDYGVPQKRERIIICGFRKKVAFEFPPPIPVKDRKTVADIIDTEAEHDKSLFVRPAIRQSRLERLRAKDFPRPYISHENVAGSITPHTFSCALRAGASANYILINDERRPSAREMLRIQGFPDEFKVVVNYGQIKHQTGNSVAVPVIRAVAERLIEKLKEL